MNIDIFVFTEIDKKRREEYPEHISAQFKWVTFWNNSMVEPHAILTKIISFEQSWSKWIKHIVRSKNFYLRWWFQICGWHYWCRYSWINFTSTFREEEALNANAELILNKLCWHLQWPVNIHVVINLWCSVLCCNIRIDSRCQLLFQNGIDLTVYHSNE